MEILNQLESNEIQLKRSTLPEVGEAVLASIKTKQKINGEEIAMSSCFPKLNVKQVQELNDMAHEWSKKVFKQQGNAEKIEDSMNNIFCPVSFLFMMSFWLMNTTEGGGETNKVNFIKRMLINEAPLKIKNRLYYDKGVTIKEEVKAEAEIHGCAITPVSFDDKEEAQQLINNYGKVDTDNKIEEIIDSNFLTGCDRTSVVLVNTINFKKNWEVPFRPEDNDFLRWINGEEFLCMNQYNKYARYHKLDGNIGVTLPYEGRKVFFTTIMKDRKCSEPMNLEEVNVYNFINDGGEQIKNLEIYLPKFEHKSNFELYDIFDPASSEIPLPLSHKDFGIINDKEEELHIEKIIQQAVITVDEAGSDAAAGSCGINYKCVPEVIIHNQPFIYIIHDGFNIFFIGKFDKPDVLMK